MAAVRSGLAPPQKAKRPPTGGTVKRATFEGIRSKGDDSEISGRLQRASRLDRVADFELQCGHHAAAERLSRRAAALRETAR
jgi:hypothetical protein